MNATNDEIMAEVEGKTVPSVFLETVRPTPTWWPCGGATATARGAS